MKALSVLFKTELILSIREFSGVLFGMILPVGILFLLGILYGDKAAYPGAPFTLLQQAVPGVMAVGICATGLMGIPLSLSAYREKKVLKRLMVTPTSPGLLLAAQVLCNLVFSLISSLLVLAAAVVFFGYTLPGSRVNLIIAYLIVLVSLYSMGMFIAGVSGTQKTANLLCTFTYFPMFFLSGATIPYEIMPRGMQAAADILPLTQGIKVLKAVSLGISDFPLAPPVIVLMGTFVVCTAGALIFFRWE